MHVSTVGSATKVHLLATVLSCADGYFYMSVPREAQFGRTIF